MRSTLIEPIAFRDVTVIGPLADGAAAHRMQVKSRHVKINNNTTHWFAEYLAACGAGAGHPYSWPWAEHLGAAPCTEPACYPKAARR